MKFRFAPEGKLVLIMLHNAGFRVKNDCEVLADVLKVKPPEKPRIKTKRKSGDR
jgi:hypothetical protein